MELDGFEWIILYLKAVKLSASFCLPAVGKIGLDYFQAFMEDFTDDWAFISADDWSLMGCPQTSFQV